MVLSNYTIVISTYIDSELSHSYQDVNGSISQCLINASKEANLFLTQIVNQTQNYSKDNIEDNKTEDLLPSD